MAPVSNGYIRPLVSWRCVHATQTPVIQPMTSSVLEVPHFLQVENLKKVFFFLSTDTSTYTISNIQIPVKPGLAKSVEFS